MLISTDNISVYIKKGKIRKVFFHRKKNSDFYFPSAKIIPGFCDAHTHLFQLGFSLTRLSLKDTVSKKDAYELIREFLREKREEKYTIVYDFDESKWKEKEFPLREEIDKLSKKPLILRRICGHFAVGNTPALFRVKNAKGLDFKTGIMKEDVPLNLSKYFPPSYSELKESIEIAQRTAIKNGITEVHDIVGLNNFKAYKNLFKDKLPLLRINIYVYVSTQKDFQEFLQEKKDFQENEFLKVKGIKIFSDGSIGAGTACLFKGYNDNKKNKGMLLLKKNEIKKWIEIAELHNLQLLVHSIGDRAIWTVVNAFSDIIKKNSLRHRIEHCELPLKRELYKIKESGLLLSLQPNFIMQWQSKGNMYEKKLGKTRVLRMNPINTIHKMGIKIAFGSDCMPIGPVYGIKSALNHPVKKQRISLDKAIKLYTETPHFFSFEEKEKGKIEKEHFADLTVLNEKEEILCVFINGKKVFPL